MRWPRRDRDGEKLAEQKAKLRRAERETAAIERAAEELAELTAEELAERVRRAFTLRRV